MKHPRLFDYMDQALTPVDETPTARRKPVEPLDGALVEAMDVDDREPVASAGD